MAHTWVFDRPHAQRITEARLRWLADFVPSLMESRRLATALDVGCGIGYFSRYLADLGFRVLGVDARQANVQEAAERCPDVEFRVGDVEDTEIRQIGPCDLVVCFGLLYHLENPFLAVRNLAAITSQLLIIESVVVPHRQPLATLIDEFTGEDQSLHGIALVPTESCLTKMLHAAGFPYVYHSLTVPDHPDFRKTGTSKQRRTVLVAGKLPLGLPVLRLLRQSPPKDPWRSSWQVLRDRILEFVRKPWSYKVDRIRKRLRLARVSYLPWFPLPLPLPYGGWWLPYDDVCTRSIAVGAFEQRECVLVQRLLREGMTVIDIGAHHGFYSLLASRAVGPSGRVIAFEPSPRERRRLLRHLALNHCTNVEVEPVALAASDREEILYVVHGADTGCNSLRFPVVEDLVKETVVETRNLDRYLDERNIKHVHLIKMDAEGAELEILKGARRTLMRLPRPIILAEVSDMRTAAWGCAAKAILEYLRVLNYEWFDVTDTSGIVPFGGNGQHLECNLVAVPRELLAAVETLIA